MTDAKWWDFTCPEEKVLSDEGLQTMLDELCDRWVYGHEVGESGYRHLQGRVVFKVGKELATVRNQTDVVLPGAHWSKTHVRDFNYCEKEGNFVRSWEKVLRKYATIQLNTWQSQCLEFWNNQNERQVYVVIDERGNHGKSWFAKYMEATHRADVCPVTDGDPSNYIEYCLGHKSKGYIFDIPRADTIKEKKAMWRAIEQIKNGLLYDRRYSPRKEWIDPPKILVFANEAPNEDLLSSDRWVIHQIADWGGDALLLPPTTEE